MFCYNRIMSVCCRLEKLCKNCLNPSYCSGAGQPFLYWPQCLSHFAKPFHNTHTLTRASMFSMLGCNLSCVFKPPLLYVFIKSPAPVADLYCRHYCFHLGTLLHNRVVSERWLLEYRKLYFKRYREAHLLQMFRKKNDFLPCLDLLRVMTILQSQAIKPNQTESTAEV